MIGTCEHCDVRGLEMHDVSELNAWPIRLACDACKSELLADDEDPRTGEPECACRGFCVMCVGGG